MNFFVLSLFFVLCQNHNVNCSFLDFMAARFSDLAASVTSTLDTLRFHVLNIFKQVEEPNQITRFMYQPPPDCNSTKVFETTESIRNKILDLDDTDSDRKGEDALAHMSTPQLALIHGKEVESHLITTVDGYVLTLHRLLPNANAGDKDSNQTVILHHGLLGSSADWILQGPNNSLPFMLSDAGYDVWMANARGNYYSRSHIFTKVTSADFWNFSWQEMGQFDLSATIDYIRKIKKYDKSNDTVDFIGHSMGSTALLVLLSSLPSYNRFIRIAILLAPLAYMANSEGPLKALTSMSTNPPVQLLKVIGDREFLASRRMPKWIAMKYCTGPMKFCCNPLFFISGGISTAISWDKAFIERIMYHVPAGTSTATIMHYGQLVMSGKFHKFNDMANEFALNQITVPIALISSDDDWLATIPDVLRLYFSIANPVDHYIIRGKNFSHSDFMWSPEVKNLVYNKIFEYLDNEQNWFSMRSNEVTSDVA